MTSRVWQTGPSGHTPMTADKMNGIEADLDTALAVPDAALAGRVVAGATAAALNATYAPVTGSPNYTSPTQAAGLSAALSIVFGG